MCFCSPTRAHRTEPVDSCAARSKGLAVFVDGCRYVRGEMHITPHETEYHFDVRSISLFLTNRATPTKGVPQVGTHNFGRKRYFIYFHTMTKERKRLLFAAVLLRVFLLDNLPMPIIKRSSVPEVYRTGGGDHDVS